MEPRSAENLHPDFPGLRTGSAGSEELECRVVDRVQEASDLMTLELEPSGSHPFPIWLPGQLATLSMTGIGQVAAPLVGDPLAANVSHTFRIHNAVSQTLSRLKTGDTLKWKGPAGIPWPIERAIGNDVLVMAGGVGMAWLRSVVLALLKDRDQFGKLMLCYGVRTPEDVLYVRQFEEWRNSSDLELRMVVEQAAADWKGGRGVVTQLISKLDFDPLAATVFMSGPSAMIRHASFGLEQRGVPAAAIFTQTEEQQVQRAV